MISANALGRRPAASCDGPRKPIATCRTANDVEQSIRIRTGEYGEESVRHEEPVGWGH